MVKCLKAAWLVVIRAWMHEAMMSLALVKARAPRTPALVSTAFCAFTKTCLAPFRRRWCC